MPPSSDEFEALLRRVAGNPNLSEYNEDQTKQGIVLEVFRRLGWDPADVDEVYAEYGSGDLKRVDYALRLDGKNRVFVEVKRCSVDLEAHQEQLLYYAYQQGVPLAVLTNGVVWWFYLAQWEATWEQRKFYSIDLQQRDADEAAARLVDFLSKENVTTEQAQRNAKEVLTSQKRTKEVRRTLPTAWADLLATPDPSIAEVVKERVEQLCGYSPTDTEVAAFLRAREGAGEPNSESSDAHLTPDESLNYEAGDEEDDYEIGQAFSLAELREIGASGRKPSHVVIAGNQIEARTWSQVSLALVKWLDSLGAVTLDRVPVATHKKGSRRFISAEKAHKNPKLGGRWVAVGDVFVDVNFSADDHIRNMETALAALAPHLPPVLVVLRA